MSKLNAFKKLIKEAVKEAIREELKGNNITEIKKEPIPSFTPNVQSILNETKKTMLDSDYKNIGNFQQAPAPNFNSGQFNPFEGIDASTLDLDAYEDPNAISESSIPDFSKLMEVMSEKGQI
jgi:hypothetical protein